MRNPHHETSPTTPSTPLKFGYGTNGFTHHRLTDVLVVLADLGYDGVALTLDHGHLDPYADELPRHVAALARQLGRHGLGVTVETGAPFLLDPWGKHLPTLMSDGSGARIDLLRRALRIAADLGSPTVHLCSGSAPDGLHQCLGQALARTELRLGLSALFRRLPSLRMTAPPESLALSTSTVHGVRSLPIAWQ